MKPFWARLNENRWWALVLGILGLAALFLLAASLNGLDFKPAVHYVSPDNERTLPGEFIWRLKQITLIQQLMLILLAVFLLGILLLLMTPEGRKRLLKTILRLALTLWLVSWVIRKSHNTALPASTEAGSLQGFDLEQPAEGVIASFTPPVISTWWILLTGTILFLALLGFGYWAWRRSRSQQSSLPRELAHIARLALDEIHAGESFDDTVIRCYVRMSKAVSTQRGLGRPQAMTPSEFAARLEQAGLPAEPVQRLTRLFEKVRYGGLRSTPTEAEEAVACLRDILHACGESL